MRPVDPRIHPSLVPAGSKPVVYAEKQPEYTPVPTVRTPGGTLVTRWVLTDAEKAAIIRGEDIYLVLMTFGQPMQPVFLSVGPSDLSSVP